MRIYIKTPLFRNSQAVPQLVEHCIGHNVWLLADFFEYAYGVEKEHSPEYTMFEYDDRIPYPDAMKKLLYPLQKKAFLYEKKILQEEMGDTSYDQKIYEQLVQYLVNTTISLNSAKSLFRKEVVSYHQKRYQPEQMLVVDNDYKVLYQGYKAPAHTTQ
ncbi:MAG: hypothetical protein LBG59_03100 [Candidatus Peribacteria bacterium]|jgi:hypothetical protein|nr:hypothetical protein [Candidatus Peribacteria bacterium]